jgi:hypothetical protein
MSYTITRNYNHDNAQKFGMMLIDYDLHYFDQRELAERLIDSLSYEFSHGGTQSLDDMVPQLLDEWLTTWTADVATMWIRNNCPQPEIDNHDESNNTIAEQMTRALYDLGSQYLNALIGSGNNVADALDRAGSIWPVETVLAE